ncbi:hypothetical protein Hanom_Chr12g01175141 [Helianthus anomalus]
MLTKDVLCCRSPTQYFQEVTYDGEVLKRLRFSSTADLDLCNGPIGSLPLLASGSFFAISSAHGP